MKEEIRCPECKSQEVICKGIRELKQERVQRYQCQSCGVNFTNRKIANTTYSAKVILESVNNYNLGLTLEESSKDINKRFHIKTYPRLISSWLNKYKQIVPYKRFRQQAGEKQEIVEKLFAHKQPYLFKYHKQKVNRFLNNYFRDIKDYLIRMKENCPDELFLEDNLRASKANESGEINLRHLGIEEKRNFACNVAEFSVKAIETNYERHEFVEDFLLINDTATFAVEIPIWLESKEIPEEIRDLIKFDNSNKLGNNKTLTGHIDILQARFGILYILDYKPSACKEKKEKVVTQLFCYALALSIRTGVWLRNFKCAWFDSDNYYEFSPSEIVLDYLKSKDINNTNILMKYRLNEGARRYFTSERFHDKGLLKRLGLDNFNEQKITKKGGNF